MAGRTIASKTDAPKADSTFETAENQIQKDVESLGRELAEQDKRALYLPQETVTPIIGIHQALVNAKKEMGPILKKARNGGFQGSKYATLDNTLDAIEDALLNNDIVLTQPFKRVARMEGDKEVTDRVLVTTLTHGPSRESIESELVVFAPYFTDPRGKKGEDTERETRDPQAIGSAITYYRRYAIQALCGIAPEDDDGNAASGMKGATVSAATSTPPARPAAGPNVERLRTTLRTRGADTVAKAKAILEPLGYNGAVGDLTEQQAGDLLAKLLAS